jgi:hypothetical protein
MPLLDGYLDQYQQGPHAMRAPLGQPPVPNPHDELLRALGGGYQPPRKVNPIEEVQKFFGPPPEVQAAMARLDEANKVHGIKAWLGPDGELVRNWQANFAIMNTAGMGAARQHLKSLGGKFAQKRSQQGLKINEMAFRNDALAAKAAPPGIGADDLAEMNALRADAGLPPLQSGQEIDMLSVGGVGRSPLPGGVPKGSPQPPAYPKTGPYQLKYNKDGSSFEAKLHTPEELALKKKLTAAQRDIDAGHYEPYFDISKRYDVDPSKYKLGPGTRTEAYPRTEASVKKYTEAVRDPAVEKRLVDAYGEGLKVLNAEDFYLVGQLEKEFIKELGAKKGRAAFKAKIADALGSTTGGANPRGNLRSAMYGNYLVEHGLPTPANAWAMPHPVGGRYISGNMAMHRKVAEAGGHSARYNPKRFDFSSAHLGNKVPVLDEQMSGLLKPGMKQPPPAGYGAYSEGVSDIALKTGVDPRNMQEIAWAGVKVGKSPGYETAKPMIQEFNEAIERTSRAFGITPKEVLIEGIIKSKIPVLAVGGVAAAGVIENEGRQLGLLNPEGL